MKIKSEPPLPRRSFRMSEETIDYPDSCRKCGSGNIDKSRMESVAEYLLSTLGFQPFRCADCSFRWNQLLPLHVLLSAIYIFLIVEIAFLLQEYMHF